jgi:lipopolysaccharide/colanic/teichoic acid biosynthesis glycosyltransferase
MTISIPDFPGGQAIVPKPTADLRPGLYRRAAKRLIDFVAVACAVPVVAPLILGLALAVACDGGNPFYTQSRVGRGGRIFRMWKLRSMVCDADARMEAHLAASPAARAEWDTTQKLRNDPRITRLGSFLRRSSLDELPQLWNVLTGEMSLVGPRPMMPCQQAIYPGTAYYALRPGITGLWQTAGRNRTTFAARAEYDAAYEARVTLGGDLAILWRTVAVVLRGTGC